MVGLPHFIAHLKEIEQSSDSTQPTVALVALGDCNASSAHVSRALDEGGVTMFRQHPPPYRTHVNAHMSVCDYDNAIFGTYNARQEGTVQFSYIPAAQLLSDPTFAATVALLGAQ
eukprot:TRINITY_DN1085_c0_g1_i4.p2 TRINITY_DN1085_c0_g1~~TRINITY_DN1085_c0_g1_i4.p2  ORF type:complete len:115 (+),score=29.15 TRINITY_DN1085_c0_g1_i4:199-543(+)